MSDERGHAYRCRKKRKVEWDMEREREKEGVHWMVFVLYSRRMKGIHEYPFST